MWFFLIYLFLLDGFLVSVFFITNKSPSPLASAIITHIITLELSPVCGISVSGFGGGGGGGEDIVQTTVTSISPSTAFVTSTSPVLEL